LSDTYYYPELVGEVDALIISFIRECKARGLPLDTIMDDIVGRLKRMGTCPEDIDKLKKRFTDELCS
jgi:hypothetical protein